MLHKIGFFLSKEQIQKKKKTQKKKPRTTSFRFYLVLHNELEKKKKKTVHYTIISPRSFIIKYINYHVQTVQKSGSIFVTESKNASARAVFCFIRITKNDGGIVLYQGRENRFAKSRTSLYNNRDF